METILTTILSFFFEFAKNWPWVASLIVVMGTLRMFLKPIMTAIQAIVKATPSTKDDETLDKVEKSMPYKAIMFIIDYIASLKPLK